MEVQVGDILACCGGNPDIVQYQWRAYSLDGDTFRQTGGPAEFPVNPMFTDLQVKSVAVEGTTTGDTFDGTVRIAIRNAGPARTLTWVAFVLPHAATLKTVPTGCVRSDYAVQTEPVGEGNTTYVCGIGETSAGQDVTLGTFQVTAPASAFPSGGQKEVIVVVRASTETAEWAEHKRIPDLQNDDNTKIVTFTVK